jgi:hypothetical protein
MELLEQKHNELWDILNDNLDYFYENVPQLTKMFFIGDYISYTLMCHDINIPSQYDFLSNFDDEVLYKKHEISISDIFDMYWLTRLIGSRCPNLLNHENFIKFITNGIKDSWYENQLKRRDLTYDEFISLLNHPERRHKETELQFLRSTLSYDKTYQLNEYGYFEFEKKYRLCSEWRTCH